MINFSVAWNTCFTDFRSWFLANRRLPKKSRPRWTAAWSVTFMNIPHTALFTSKSFSSSVGLWPKTFRAIEYTFSTWGTDAGDYENYVATFCFQLWNSLNFLNFWTQQVSPSLLSGDCSRIQNQKIRKMPDFYLSRQLYPLLQPPRYASFSLPWELDAASGFEYPLRFPCRSFEYSQAFRRNRMVHGWGTCRDSGSQVHRHRLWFCHIPVFFPCLSNYFRFAFLSSNSMLVFSQVFPIIVPCCLCVWHFHCLKHRNKLDCSDLTNSSLFLQCDLHDICEDFHPFGFS